MCRLLAWRSVGVDDVDLRFNRLPKAAVHSANAHLASAAGVLALMPFAAGDDWLLSLPLFHVSGQGIVWRWLLAGARLTVRDKQPLAQMLHGCTHASLVPTQLWRLLNDDAAVSLKAVLLGGASIPVELTERARSRAYAASAAMASPNSPPPCVPKRPTALRMLASAAGARGEIVAGEIGCGVEYGRRLLAGWSIVVINQQ
ncbi:O-succinylbenzoic acid--CoA ligase [Klebsiella pneumoniae subsp. ozaenae]|uniref:O-succinylbenzoic acid--CoA ligase n=1 Tax=Klebsiella pneumoniae subsp. ozaenae TaxID=574 RepID=A0A378A4A7_KLEPO|nr:O-succinylbenzoic acid--CoA ligase [Klebsiella pneumoniae subsp. ozaenae]